MANYKRGGYTLTKVQFSRQLVLHTETTKFYCKLLWLLFCKKKDNPTKITWTGEQNRYLRDVLLYCKWTIWATEIILSHLDIPNISLAIKRIVYHISDFCCVCDWCFMGCPLFTKLGHYVDSETECGKLRMWHFIMLSPKKIIHEFVGNKVRANIRLHKTIQGDQNIFVQLMITVQRARKNILHLPR
jgi:hypothetical protein